MRMLCTRCWRTARPDTRIDGSDRGELVAWLCLALPGLLYCWWRHAGRTRVCPACGSLDLVREARAARGRRSEELAFGGGRLRSARPLRWPRALATPRERLRHGGLGVVFAAGIAAERGLALLVPGPADPAAGALFAVGAGAGWLLYAAARAWRLRVDACACEAFDERGRRLPIEALP